jgi:sugar phosphate isomerase/epimerase
VCDGNRLAPGWGHVNLKEVLATLKYLEYEGWVTVEALQVPTPDAAVVQSGRHLREILLTLDSLPARFHT